MKNLTLVLSCEHAVNTIPAPYRLLFHNDAEILQSHRAIDLGAMKIARQLSSTFACPLVSARASRLLIDCNRSLSHKDCFSEFTRSLDDAEKQRLIDDYYVPYRQEVTALIQQRIDQGQSVLHLSIHSFTPVLNGVIRTADIGLLYDPLRRLEKKFVMEWKQSLLQQLPRYRIRRNYPYLGNSDGLTTAFRKQFRPDVYLGIEVETNQALTVQDSTVLAVIEGLSGSLKMVLERAWSGER